MTEIATSVHSLPRAAVIAAGAAGVLLAGALALWGFYGTAVFTETILSGLAGCF